jgi:hypothetical protein
MKKFTNTAKASKLSPTNLLPGFNKKKRGDAVSFSKKSAHKAPKGMSGLSLYK